MFKKLLLVVALLITSAQTMQAATFSYKAVADLYHYKGSFVSDTNYQYLHAASNYGTSFIKFDFSQELSNQMIDLINEDIVSAELKLYLFYSNKNNNVAAYLYNDDSWAEPGMNKTVYTSARTLNQSFMLGSTTTSTYNNMQDLLEVTINLNSNLISIGADNKISIAIADKTIVGTPAYTPMNDFASREYFNSAHSAGYYAPVLTITTSKPAPTPEPSSMILGLIGLSGIIGLKKRNKK
jgi:hypothetical protein